MKSIFILSAFLLSSFFINAQTETFAKKKSLKDDIPSRHSSQMVSYNNKLYFFGGYNQGVSSTTVNDFWEYTPTTKTFVQLPLPTNVSIQNQRAITHVIGNKMYTGSFSTWRQYDFTTATWSAIASFPGDNIGSSGKQGNFVINDTIFVLSGSSKTFFSYNIVTNTWTRRADFPGVKRLDCINFSINGKGYMGGGRTIDAITNPATPDFYEYNPITNVWVAKSNVPFFTTEGVSEVVNNKAYVGTGRTFTGISNGIWKEYNPINDTWVDKSTAPIVHTAASATVGTDIFVFSGGFNVAGQGVRTTSAMHRYNTITNVWSVDSSVAGGNRAYANAMHYNNKIFVTGGADGQSYNDTWMYDIATDNWTRKADIPTYFVQRAQARIGSKLYLIGGYNQFSSGSNYSNQLLEYDMDNNTWATKTAFPVTGGLRNMAAFVINNELYAGLGWAGTSTPLQNYKGFYKYNFTTNAWVALANCPASGTGELTGSFAIADTGYVVFADGNMYAYNRVNNTWSQKSSVIENMSGTTSNNCAFVLGNQAYTIGDAQVGFGQFYSHLKKYNPSTNTWSVIKRGLKLRFNYLSAVANDSVAFIGMGSSYSKQNPALPFEFRGENDWVKFSLKADIATKAGDIAATAFELNGANEIFSLYDSSGAVLMAAIGVNANVSTGNISGRIADTTLPYRENTTAIISSGPANNIMFLNKNILIINGLVTGTKIRLYFTNREIAKFITAFNTKYGTSLTENNIRFFRHSDNGNLSANDLNPINNTAHTPYNYVVVSIMPYNDGKFFEMIVPTGEVLVGEVYAILSTTGSALPLNLVSFNAVLQNKQVFTQWQTTNEVNVSHMNVQRSADGINFSSIGRTEATGNGNYGFTDATLPANVKTLYYRLEVVDNTGEKQFSKIVAVQLAKNNMVVNVYPNPVKNQLFASINSIKQELVTIQVTDLQGKVFQNRILKLNIGNNNFNITTSALAKGVYLLVIKSDVLQQIKFVKE
ncbi:MAG: T9SS type A sorting domain-containing protein [Chitinophagaceae bacterium]|jgi:hypothetical protein|nr:T9SS type A sorting domain-containing protein [Chitinophagaceae bacterium]